MKKEDRDLLLKDLCGRLPYGVKICLEGRVKTLTKISLLGLGFDGIGFCDFRSWVMKPYLFPLSGLSNEQFKIVWDLEHRGDMEHLSIPLLDWLNEHHFDYRGLIEKGLAIDATGLDIYKEEQK